MSVFELLFSPFVYVIRQVFLGAYALTGNYGVSIILLSFVVSLLLLPVFVLIEKAKKRDDAFVALNLNGSVKCAQFYFVVFKDCTLHLEWMLNLNTLLLVKDFNRQGPMESRELNGIISWSDKGLDNMIQFIIHKRY